MKRQPLFTDDGVAAILALSLGALFVMVAAIAIFPIIF
jgi:hypothetical protein